jgi:hypothetical protein
MTQRHNILFIMADQMTLMSGKSLPAATEVIESAQPAELPVETGKT